METRNFTPYHLTGTPEDLNGNQGIGRYIFLCGSDERARRISREFDGLQIREHPRQHHLYLGSLSYQQRKIDVASIATGVGCPSTDNIVNELILLGGRRFLRIGTAGSLQPEHIKVGDVVIATGAVRDEDTSACYIAPEYPAIASFEMVSAARSAAERLKLEDHVYSGVIHTKSSFYAREMGQSFLAQNYEYMDNLKKAGVMATEMECSHIFILSSVLGHRESLKLQLRKSGILSGGILAIVGDNTPISSEALAGTAIDRAITLGFETIRLLAGKEC